MPTWLRNPFSRGSSDPEQASDTEALPSGSPPAPAGSSSPPGLVSFPDAPRPSQDVAAILTHFKTPTRTLTGHQIFYIFVVDGLGAAVLSGGINFAIAYGTSTFSSILSRIFFYFSRIKINRNKTDMMCYVQQCTPPKTQPCTPSASGSSPTPSPATRP